MSVANQHQFQESKDYSKLNKANIYIRKLSDLEALQPNKIFKLCQFNQQQLFKPSMLLNKILIKTKLTNKNLGILQIFTIIYFRICFNQLLQNNYSNSINTILQLIDNSQFKVTLNQNHPLYNCSQETIKQIFIQFIYYIYDHYKYLTVENAFEKYPSMLDAFSSIFKQLLQIEGIGYNHEDESSIQQIYEFLALYFDIEISIDTVNNYVFFYKINTFVIQEGQNSVCIVQQEQEDNQPRSPINILKQQQKLQQKQKENKTIKSVRGGRISKLLTSNSSQNQSDDQVTKMVSNFQIPIQSETCFQNIASQFISKFPLVQSNIIKQKLQNSLSIKQGLRLDLQKNVKESMATTCHSLERKSVTQNSSNYLCNFVEKASSVHNNFQMPIIKNNEIKSNFELQTSKEQHKNKQYYMHDNSSKKNQFQLQAIQIQDQKYSYQNLNIKSILYVPENLSYSYLYQTQSTKQNSKWVNKNITKQFTSSFILQSVCEPYKTKIEEKKKMARAERKNIMQLNCYK